MQTDSSTELSNCPHCDVNIEVRRVWTPGGVNDRGGFALQCQTCGKSFDYRVGKDVNMSSVVSGAVLLDRYDDEVGDRAIIMARHGISG